MSEFQICPAMYILVSASPTKWLFTAIWQRIAQLMPEIRNNLRRVHGTHDPALTESVIEVFPGVIVDGHWFEYCAVL